MKRLAALKFLTLLVLTAAGLTACTHPIAAQQDEIQTYPQVHLTSHWLQTWTRVQPPIVHVVGSGQKEVAVPIRNLTNEYMILEYQYRFLRGGAEAEQPSTWHTIRIPPRSMGTISFTSMVTTADDFDLTIRWRRQLEG